MRSGRLILLRFRSNIAEYQITVYGNGKVIRKRIYAGQGSLCICACASCLRVVATPLVSGYSTLIYSLANTNCGGTLDFFFNFPVDITPTPKPALQTFTLTDANYGLPIDGSLLFVEE